MHLLMGITQLYKANCNSFLNIDNLYVSQTIVFIQVEITLCHRSYRTYLTNQIAKILRFSVEFIIVLIYINLTYFVIIFDFLSIIKYYRYLFFDVFHKLYHFRTKVLTDLLTINDSVLILDSVL